MHINKLFTYVSVSCVHVCVYVLNRECVYVCVYMCVRALDKE